MPSATALSDEHSILLWEACAYSDELTRAAHSGAGLDAACNAMLEFLHYRLLPYLCAEERRFCDSGLRDRALAHLLVADHDRIRAHVDTLAASRTPGLRVISSSALVDRLDRHVQREQSWLLDNAGAVVTPVAAAPVDGWALPLVLVEHVDLDALPEEIAEELVLQKIQRMRCAEVFWLHASHDLHRLWVRQQAVDPGRHSWVYEQEGPHEWVVRIGRHDDEEI
jgi:uncharacterized protein (DUF2249 family)